MKFIQAITWISVYATITFAYDQIKFTFDQDDEGVITGTPLDDLEQNMNTIEIIEHYGYEAEKYKVQTEDGYILEIHRILHPREKIGIPVLLMHGILCSSAVFVDNTVNNSLGFLLSDEGYDVWMGNVRGNVYSRLHVAYHPADEEFWDFKFDDYALKDLPAIIDFILGKTKAEQMMFVGHSLGASKILALLSAKPEYNSKMKSLTLLAPVTQVINLRSIIVKTLIQFAEAIKFSLSWFGMSEVFNKEMTDLYVNTICRNTDLRLCMLYVYETVGKDPEQFNMSRLNVYLSHVPSPTSVETLYQLAQWHDSGKFCAYDYGTASFNKAAYKSETPPLYDVRNISVPVAVFSADNDLLSDPLDVAWLTNRLPNLYLNYRIPYKKFNHMDYIWAKDAKKLVYDKLIETMKKMETL